MICVEKEPEVMEADDLHAKGGALEYLSASRVNCWQQCRRKFYFRYVEKIPSKPSPALHVGKVVHATLQSWNQARWSKRPMTRDALKQCFSRHWDQELQLNPVTWKSSVEEVKQMDLAWNCLEAYWDSNTIPEDELILAVEVRLDAKLEGLPPLVGIVDLVRDGGVIVDFKTAAKTPNFEVTEFSHGLQLTMYALLFRKATGLSEHGVELHHIVKTKSPKVLVQKITPIDDSKIAELESTLHNFVDSVEKHDWSPSPNFMCGSCEYFTQCKQWKGGATCH